MARKKRTTSKRDDESKSVDLMEPRDARQRESAESATHDPPSEDETSLEPAVAGEDEAESADEALEIEQLIADAQEMRLLAQRKQAEFENYRKRVERERAETVKHAASELVKEILPILDNLERAVEAARSGDTGDEGQLREGVGIVCKQLRDTLGKQGLEEIEALHSAFDPHVHEAVNRVDSPDHPDGTVVAVFQKGYTFKDRLLRPAMVTVSQRASDDGDGA